MTRRVEERVGRVEQHLEISGFQGKRLAERCRTNKGRAGRQQIGKSCRPIANCVAPLSPQSSDRTLEKPS